MEAKQQKFSIWYFVAALVGLLLLPSLFFAPHPENVSYSEFKALLKQAQTLTAKRAMLDALAKFLIEHEVVDRAALTRLLSAAPSA